MGLKILLVASFIVVSILILPQIWSQEPLRITSVCCLDSLNNKMCFENDKVLRGVSDYPYKCTFSLSKSNDEPDYSKCVIKFRYQNDSYVFGRELSDDDIIQFNQQHRLDFFDAIKPLPARSYDGYFVMKCDNKETSHFNATLFLEPSLDYFQSQLLLLQIQTYNQSLNNPIVVAQIQGNAYLLGAFIGLIGTIVVTIIYSLKDKGTKEELRQIKAEITKLNKKKR